jgi:hypothetical protein
MAGFGLAGLPRAVGGALQIPPPSDSDEFSLLFFPCLGESEIL